MANHPTLRDVAELAQVSEMTVSRVLRGKGDATEKTRMKVLEAAKKIGYVPNKIAGALSSSRVNLVGLVVPSLSNMVFSEVVMGISEGLRGSDLQAVFGVTHYDLDEECRVIREMLSWRPSGLIVAGLEHRPNTTRAMAAADIPVVEIMDIDGHPTDLNVGISHIHVGHDMAQAFLARGYQKIAYIGSKLKADFRARKRYDGFCQGLKAQGISLCAECLFDGGSGLARGREETEALLKRAPEVEAIYYSTDFLAAGGLMHCIANGISVPQSLAIAGFNGLELLDGLPQKIATTNANRFETGRIAADLIRRALAGENIDPVIKLSGDLDLGETL